MTYFGEHTPKLGFGMMRLPRTNGQIDIEETKKMVDAFIQLAELLEMNFLEQIIMMKIIVQKVCLKMNL